ncbi:MAG: hypothetical protein LKM38_03880 [Pseudomonas veronii]|nr:hypothetical protein [Pseudomonas veronii]
MISGTITDASGRTLSGQTAEAFWNSLSPRQAAVRSASTARSAPSELRQYVEELSRKSATLMFGAPERRPAQRLRRLRRNGRNMADEIADWAQAAS